MLNWKWVGIGIAAVCLGPFGIPFMLGVIAIAIAQRDHTSSERPEPPAPEHTVTPEAIVTKYGTTRW